MEEIITKELLSVVLEIDNILEYRQSVNVIWVTDAKSHCGAIAYNIYELAHKCKEWANTKGYSAISWYPDFEECKGIKAVCRLYEPFKDFSDCSFSCIADTEPEAIFKACQWILDNKDKS